MAEVVRYAGIDLRTAGLFMSVADGVANPPSVRGRNLQIPYMHGQRWAQKYYDERVIVLTGELHSLVSRADMQTKLDTLKALFPIGSGEQKLEIQRADGSFRYVMAEIRNTMGLQWLVWPTRSVPYSIELVASDPFWYGSALEAGSARNPWLFDSGVLFDDGVHVFDTTAPYFAQSLVQRITQLEASNLGTAYTRRPVFILVGPSNGLKITNLRNGYSLALTGAATRATIDCAAQTVNTDAANPTVTLGAGQTDWMRIEAGANTLSVDLGVYTAPVAYQAQYSPAYL